MGSGAAPPGPVYHERLPLHRCSPECFYIISSAFSAFSACSMRCRRISFSSFIFAVMDVRPVSTFAETVVFFGIAPKLQSTDGCRGLKLRSIYFRVLQPFYSSTAGGSSLFFCLRAIEGTALANRTGSWFLSRLLLLPTDVVAHITSAVPLQLGRTAANPLAM